MFQDMYEQYPAHCPFATRCKCGFKIAAIVNKKKSWEELSAIEGSGFDAEVVPWTKTISQRRTLPKAGTVGYFRKSSAWRSQ